MFFSRIARLALRLQDHCRNFVAPDCSVIKMRIGLVTGPAMGGVVGASMLRYHLFGPTTQEVRERGGLGEGRTSSTSITLSCGTRL